MLRYFVFSVALVLMLVQLPSCAAADPPADEPLNLFEELRNNGPRWLHEGGDWLGRREAVEMLGAILGGGRMGPGGGWFHPGQSRYGWHWLAGRCDLDHDGRISRKEYRGSTEIFDRLDRDGDGVITAADFDWSDRSAFLREINGAKQLFSQLDRDSNGRISRAEWESLFEKLAGEKGYLTPADLRPLMQASSLGKKAAAVKPGPAGGGMPATSTLLLGLISGELGSLCEGPQIGDKAPGFRLATHDGKQQYSLAQFRDKKPVVLIFGSFT